MHEDSWGPWKDHDGKGRPAEVAGRLIRFIVEQEAGDFHEGEEIVPRAPYHGCNVWDWTYHGGFCVCAGFRIPALRRYRLHEPKAMDGLKALIEAPEELPALEVLDA